MSPAAPAHHFGDAAGLLTAVATQGFAGLTQALRDGVASGGDDALAALRGQGQAYVRFALRHPGRFRLMFRKDMLCADDALTQHAGVAFEELAAGVADAAAMTPVHWNAVITLWSLVHGYAHLAIAGRFEPFGAGHAVEDFVDATLPAALDAALAGLFNQTRKLSGVPPAT